MNMERFVAGFNLCSERNFQQLRIASLSATLIVLIHSAASVNAEPIIVGNQIQTPDDGWYQVQNASSYEQICGGQSVCSVVDGTYHVINHTTGERFENIVVSDTELPDEDPAEAQDIDPLDSADDVEVSGNRISFADDGWYQVQNAETFEVVCAGANSCDVPNGVFIVVNHSTGMRLEGVEVPQADSLTGEGVLVIGNRILWPDDGWYQVQDAETFDVICAGTSFCDVDDGTYIVVNHTTGQRYENVIVGDNVSPDDATDVDDTTINALNAMEIWREIVAVVNEDRINDLFNSLESELNFIGKELFLGNTVDEIVLSETFEADPPYLFQNSLDDMSLVAIPEGSLYTCASGGNVASYMGSTGYDNVFDQCAVGSLVYDGMTGTRDFFIDEIGSQPWENFARTTSTGDSTMLSGRSFAGNESLGFIDQTSGWSDLDFVQTGDAGEFSLNGYSVTRTSFDSEFAAIPNVGQEIDGIFVPFLVYELAETISGSFSVAASWTGSSEPLNVDIDLRYQDNVVLAFDNPELEFPARDTEQPFYWEEGSVSINATDGSSLTATPSETPSGSFVLTLDDGEVVGVVPSVDEFEVKRGVYP